MAAATSTGSPTPDDITAAVSNAAATASRAVNRRPEVGATRMAPYPNASESMSCVCHPLMRFSKPVPAAANTAQAHVATQPSTAARVITYQSSTTITRWTAIVRPM